MMNIAYEEASKESIEDLLQGELILLVSVTEIETRNIHLELKPIPGKNSILQVYIESETYFIGVFGKYKIAHVQCAMGSLGRSSVIMTVNKALGNLKSRVAFMIGIAFGIDDEKQNVGDVLIAESIIPYNIKRVGKDNTKHRGKPMLASNTLVNRLKGIKDWEHMLGCGSKSELIFTEVLSGEELIDNKEHRDELIENFSNSKGGEMEGIGFYSACEDKADCILIKGICDFADGNKGDDKEARQIEAVRAAISISLKLFNSDFAFNTFSYKPYHTIEKPITLDQNLINNLLFNIYNTDREIYYVERSSDRYFDNIISQYSVWVYGPTGCGKSNMILRGLIKNSHKKISINLGVAIGEEVVSLFEEIYYEIFLEVHGDFPHDRPSNFRDCTRKIVELFEKNYKGHEIFIFIEEIPLGSDSAYENFTKKLMALIVSLNFNSDLSNIKFILSSIDDPRRYINQPSNKIHQYMKFLQLGYWVEDDTKRLIEVINGKTNWLLKEQINELDLISKSKGSPRFVKKFFKNLLANDKKDSKTLKFVLKETESELF